MKCRFCKSIDTEMLFKKFEDKERKNYEGGVYLCFSCGKLSFYPKRIRKTK